MLYRELAEFYGRLETEPSKLCKSDILAELYRRSSDDLYKIVLLSIGSVYPQGGLDLGMAAELVKKAIGKSYGISGSELEKKFRETGDLGSAAEFFSLHKKQSTLTRNELTVEKVFSNLRKLPDVSGKGSQDTKNSIISELLTQSQGKEARYIVRTVIGEMRVGVSFGLVRDAIAKAFGHSPENVEHAYDITGDYGKVAEMARSNSLDVKIEMGNPIRVMLADRSPSITEAIKAFEKPAVEMKLDGFRAQIHKSGKTIKIFSRRLDDVTRQFPDVAEMAGKCLGPDKVIIESEIVAVSKDGKPLPFQSLSRRIQRKYEIGKMAREIPVCAKIFDIIFLNGESLMDEALEKRWSLLAKALNPAKGKFELVEHMETSSAKEAEKFYKHCLSAGEEGVIVKNLEAKYQPGKRVGYWLKVKPVMDPLDLVVIGATWGEGKRASWLGSLLLGIRDSESGEFLETGMLGSGLSEAQLEEITSQLKKFIISENGRNVKIKPHMVVEVAYEEIQKSPTYPSGYALRFPRLLRIRDNEKTIEESDTLKTMEKLFKSQKGNRSSK